MNDKQLKKYVKERNAAILSFDIDIMKKFCKKYEDYLTYIPPDDVLYAAFLKCVADIREATPEQKKRAADWLTEHGYGARCY